MNLRTKLAVFAVGGSAALLSGCNDGTVLDVEATSMAGARVTYGDVSTTLDAFGNGTLTIPAVYNGYVTLEFDRGGAKVELTAECIPGSFEDPAPIDRIRLLGRRRSLDGQCALIALQLEQDGATSDAQYEPNAFDDAPCGPFASP